MEVILGGGQYGGDLYTGLDAQNLFRDLQAQSNSNNQDQQDDKKKSDDKKKTDDGKETNSQKGKGNDHVTGADGTQLEIEPYNGPKVITGSPADNPLFMLMGGPVGAIKMTQWGWRGASVWKNLVKTVKSGGTIESLLNKIPTKQEAIQLIEEAGGKIERIESGHPSPNPHNFDHINYRTSSGVKGTIKIKDL